MDRRVFISSWGALVAPWPSQAMAADMPRSYAVLSLMGDRIAVVAFQMTTGSHLDTNDRSSFPVADGVFDKMALLAAMQALKRVDAAAKVTLYAPRAPGLFEDQDRFFVAGKLQLPADVHAAIREGGSTHLLLITKRRADARMQALRGKIGSGKVEGLGFYVDNSIRTRSGATGESGHGMLAPYVYMNVCLVDVLSMEVLAKQAIESTSTYSGADAKEGTHPWDALTAEQKVAILRDSIESSLAETIPKLMR